MDFESLDNTGTNPEDLEKAKDAARKADVPNVDDLPNVGYVLNQCFEELYMNLIWSSLLLSSIIQLTY